MPLKINKPISIENQDLYANDIKTYSGFYFDNLSVKTATGFTDTLAWSSIAVNENNGHTVIVANTGATNGTNAMLYSTDGGDTFANITLSSGTNNWKSIVYGGGKFVAVSASGTSTTRIAYSTGASQNNPTLTAHWGFSNAPLNNNWESVTYGNGYFIAVSNNGANRVMTSLDGITWGLVNKDFLNSAPWESITYGNELKRFVAVASNGKIVYADFNGDLDSWKEASPRDNLGNTISVAFNQVIWSSKLKSFIAVGNSGKIMRSETGELWINVTFSGVNDFSSIIWNQELEILALLSTANYAFTSYVITGDNPVMTTRSLGGGVASTWSYGIWNRYHGSYIIVSSSGTTGQRILVSKISGLKHFLEKKYYYDLINLFNLSTFEYTNNKIRSSIGSTVKSYPLLNELLNFTYSNLDTFPEGVTLNSITGEIIVTSTKSLPNLSYRILASSDLFILTSIIEIYVAKEKEIITELSYTENSLTTDLIDSIILFPTIKTGTDYTFSFSVVGISNLFSFPNGLNFNIYTGVIKGIPTEIQQTIGYRITATNTSGSTSKDISITIYLLKTTVEAGDLRGDISTDGEWLGYISYFYSNTNIIGGKINKNYFFDDSGKLSFNNILTIATRRTLSQRDGISYAKKELVFTVYGDYRINANLTNWTSITLGSYTFLYTACRIEIDETNLYTRFLWEITDNINYFPNKDNPFYITGKRSSQSAPIIVIAPSGLSYGFSSQTILTGTLINYMPTLTNGFATSYSISPGLPSGLSINSTSGLISGTAPFVSNDTTYTITAFNSAGSATTSLRIRIVYVNTTMTVGSNIDGEGFGLIGYVDDNPDVGSLTSNIFKNGIIIEMSATVDSNGNTFSAINFNINIIVSNDNLSAFNRITWNNVVYLRSSFSYSTGVGNTYFTYNSPPSPPFNLSTFVSNGTPTTTPLIIE